MSFFDIVIVAPLMHVRRSMKRFEGRRMGMVTVEEFFIRQLASCICIDRKIHLNDKCNMNQQILLMYGIFYIAKQDLYSLPTILVSFLKYINCFKLLLSVLYNSYRKNIQGKTDRYLFLNFNSILIIYLVPRPRVNANNLPFIKISYMKTLNFQMNM